MLREHLTLSTIPQSLENLAVSCGPKPKNMATTQPHQPQTIAPAAKGAPSASLYVGDLLHDVSEGMLFELFNNVGPVSSIRVCRDTNTRRSLGYAYVNFHSVVDAERALDTLNNTPIAGKPCRIMWSQRDPTIRRSGIGNVFIKNLDPSITHKELYDTFSQFGSILSCKVAMNENGESKGYGFVHFESQKSAEQAASLVNDNMLASKKVFVGPFIPKKVRSQQTESSWTNVYVKDIDPAMSDAEFEQLFAAYGNVTSPVVVRKEGQPTAYGFVNFEKHEDAVKAVDALHGAKFGSKNLFCCRAQKKQERRLKLKKEWEQMKLNKYQGINLYIKHLEDDIDEERLKKEFSPFGNIISCKIMTGDNNNSKGFGFICFNTTEEASRAISDMNGRTLPGCQKPLYVALHEPKEVRRAKLTAQRMATKQIRPQGSAPPMFPGAPVYYSNNVPQYGYPQQMVPQMRAWGQPQGYPLPYAPGAMGIVPARTVPAARGGRGAQPHRGGAGGRPNKGRNQPQHIEPVTVDFNLQTLSQYPFEQQKLILGEKLYTLIGRTHPELAGKITGMFLDSGWSIEELFSLLTDEAKLGEKIDDAVTVLENAQLTDGQEQPTEAN
jgi:polyadenylate-binding protein